MKRKPLRHDPAGHRRPAACSARPLAPRDSAAIQRMVEATHCAREFMASAPAGRTDQGVPAGVTTEALAAQMRSRFGEQATTVAAWCAMLAWSEGTDADCRIWTETFKSMRAAR